MINAANIQTFRKYGLVLTPVHKSKDPKTDKNPVCNAKTNWTWSNKAGYEWTDQELLDANRIGAYHNDSGIMDVDFDDKTFNAHKFIDMLPPTLTIGKNVNGREVPTHKIYKKKDNVKFKPYSYPTTAAKGGKIIETLTSGQTIIAGVDRVIINNVEPTVIDPRSLSLELRLIVAFSELYPLVKDIKNRNDFYFKLGGALARESDVPMDLRIKYVEKLCELTNDNEVRNRVGCIERQQENFKERPDEVFGMKELSEFLGANLKGFDEIKREVETVEEEEKKATGLSFLNSYQFSAMDFPKPEYLLYPLVAKQQIRQVFAGAGTGKTLLMLHEACALAGGYDFLHYKNEKKTKTPVLYVEGEMDSSMIDKRKMQVEQAYEREGKEFPHENLFLSTLALQKDMHFESLTTTVGRLNVEITVKQIEKITGIKPVIYLDNITALTLMQEKEGADWIEFMQWTSKMRNRGYHITFLHHPTKTGETASGSNIKERSIDIDMKLSTPDEKTSLEEFDDVDHTQICIEFKKWREHQNTFYSKKRIAVISRSTNKWEIFPMLTKTQRSIYNQLKEGKKAEDIINPVKEGMSKANVYKTIKILKSEGVIENETN